MLSVAQAWLNDTGAHRHNNYSKVARTSSSAERRKKRRKKQKNRGHISWNKLFRCLSSLLLAPLNQYINGGPVWASDPDAVPSRARGPGPNSKSPVTQPMMD